MPSWWTRKSQTVTTKDKQEKCRNSDEDRSNRGSKTGKKQKREKAKSFDETVLVSHNFSTRSRYLKTLSVSDTVNKAAEKEAYPLPRPTRSLELPPVKFYKRDVMFSSEMASTSSSPSSGSSTSALLDVDVSGESGDHGDFGSFRAIEELECNSGLIISHQGSEASRTEKLHQNSHIWETNMEFQTTNDEKWRQLCHPLPLPPCYLRSSSLHYQSKWIKGRLLGRGSFGQVYAGFNSTNGQLCAIKEVRSLSEDKNTEDCLKQLNQEVAVLSHLSHPNIVQYYGSELGKGLVSMYLEYVSGGSVHKLLQEYGAFKEPLIRSYTRQILCALAYLHARNTVHRDIKGTNILVDPNGEIKLADFGMAKHITSCTSVFSFKGSPHWMAPEVILNTSCSGLAVDIWSLGCTVIEMATSKPPWSQYDGVAAIFKIANSKDSPPIPAHLSEVAHNFLKLCLQKDPFVRPTAAQLLNHPFIQD